MKILVVHNRYRQSGGEDAVVRAESSLLARMGHDVEVWEESNDSIVGTLEKIKTAFQCVYSSGTHGRCSDKSGTTGRTWFTSTTSFHACPRQFT